MNVFLQCIYHTVLVYSEFFLLFIGNSNVKPIFVKPTTLFLVVFLNLEAVEKNQNNMSQILLTLTLSFIIVKMKCQVVTLNLELGINAWTD